MRGFLLLAAFSLLATTTTLAQNTNEARTTNKGRIANEARAAKSPEVKAGKMTERMTKELTLTPEQTAKVKELNYKLAADIAATRPTEAEQKQRREQHERVRALRAGYDSQLKAILNPDQYTRYEQQRAERKDRMKHHREGKGRAGKQAGKRAMPTEETPAQK